ncbi:hypothetical protein SEA_DIANE_53 [Streptomyces phage Diane]|uniref:Uncharacterized protein n=1 Tax=Streptomyces phage Diane TaxID=2041207 RepID=A0A291LHK1_9CAUD|nr:hypothetical protein KGG78_gp53 [Streptomyces phage Diane]ATI18837.1 hypothetical protein SEA_DIANE_53 [Streptomyces phage Diane]
MMTRPEYLIQRYPTLMSSEREARLPKWAQAKLADLRLLLMQEASGYEDALTQIERLEGGHHQ